MAGVLRWTDVADTQPLLLIRARPVVGGRPATTVALVSAAGLVAATMTARLSVGPVVGPWQASQFWLDYSGGFLRRGLPGQTLTLLTGGAPTSTAVAVAALAMFIIGGVAIATLAFMLASRVRSQWQPAVSAIALASPFTVSLLVLDLGRFDVIGYAVCAALAVVAVRSSPAVVAVVAAVLLLVAAGTEEFLVVFLAPLAALALRRAGSTRPSMLATAAASPAVALAAVSVLARPSTDQLRAAVGAAHQARSDIPEDGAGTAISALTQGLDRALTHLGEMDPWTLPAHTALYGGLYIVAALVLRAAAGAPREFTLWAASFAGAAVALSVIGIDYRRWWALAFVALLAATVLLARPVAASRPSTSTVWVAVAVLVLALAQAGPMNGAATDGDASTNLTIPAAQAARA